MNASDLERLPHLVDIPLFLFDLAVAVPFTKVVQRSFDRLTNPACGNDVIILDQDHFVETKPVIDTASQLHGQLVKDAQPRGCLSGVRDAGARSLYGTDELSRQGCDTAHPLKNIQRRPLGLQYPRKRALD